MCICILVVLFNLLFVYGGNVFSETNFPVPPTLPPVPESHVGPTHLCLSFSLCTHSSFALWVHSHDPSVVS